MAKQLRNWRQAMADPAAPQCLQFFLKVASGPNLPAGLPPLFATLKLDLPGRLRGPVKLRKGERVRVVQAGKFGDVGVTTDMDGADIAMARASVDELEQFSEAP